MSGMLILTACNFAPVISGESSKVPGNQGSGMADVKNPKAQVMDTEGPAQTNPAPEHKPSDPKGMFSNDSGKTYYLSLMGLKVHTAAPTTGPAKVAWDFSDYQGKQQYDKALLCLSGHEHHDTMVYDGLTGKLA